MSPLVIVDLDGTLLDTRARHHRCYVAAVGELGGEPLPLGAFWAAKRRGVAWPPLLARTLGREPTPRQLSLFHEHWRNAIERPDMLAHDSLQPGALHALRSLRGGGHDLVLATARRDEAAAHRQLAALGLEDFFHLVVVTGGLDKPAAVRARVGAATIAGWIGDTEEDVAAARVLGVPVIAVTNGIRAPSRLLRERPDQLAASVRQAAARLLVMGALQSGT